MGRRLQIGTNIFKPAETPSAIFAVAGDSVTATQGSVIITIPITSLPIPKPDPKDPQKHTHRDVTSIGNDFYGGAMSITVNSNNDLDDTEKTSSVTIRFQVNSKVPGSGAAGLVNPTK